MEIHGYTTTSRATMVYKSYSKKDEKREMRGRGGEREREREWKGRGRERGLQAHVSVHTWIPLLLRLV